MIKLKIVSDIAACRGRNLLVVEFFVGIMNDLNLKLDSDMTL